MAIELCVFAEPEAEVEANCDQVDNVVDSGIEGGGFCSDDEVNDYQGGRLFLMDGEILEPVGLKLPHESLVKPGVHLRIGWFYGVR